jgi:glycosyltransferase involved in cell wall biosynthesis
VPWRSEAGGDVRESLRGRLNALIVCLSNSWGGLEQVAAADALEAGALGYPVRVLCSQGSPIHEHLARRPEVSVIPTEIRPRNTLDLGMRGELLRLIGEGVNLVHTHQTTLLGSLSPWLWGRPRVALLASRHILNNHDKRDFYHRWIYRRVDALIVMSQTLRRNVLATHAIRESAVKVVNLGLDFQRFDPARVDATAQRAAWGADASTLVVGLVGRIDPAKGQATFIRAAAGILKDLRAGEKVKFVVVGEETLGSSGGHLAELRKMVAQFRIGEHVVFAGYQENIPQVMRAFDIFVMPSRQEAFGLVAIEAMAMECPIIISSGGSAEEIITGSGDAPSSRSGEGPRFGLTMRPEDAFDLQRQLRHLMEHPAERKAMGKGARAHVVAHYDRHERLQRTLEIYARALKRRGS